MAAKSPDERLATFVRRLAQRLEVAFEEAQAAGLWALRPSLALADASLRDLGALDANPARPPQIVVLGPTQVGKSTVVNLLVGTEVAAVSPLAGFTVHPSAFVLGSGMADLHWLDAFFPGWERVGVAMLGPERLDVYGLEVVEPGTEGWNGLGGCMLWDTPDFDSLASRHYRLGILEVAALADVVVLVLSREKYSDMSVWEVLGLLEALERPLLICLNKSTDQSEAVVAAALRERLRERAPAWADAEIVTLPSWSGGRPGDEAADLRVRALRGRVADAVSESDRQGRREAVYALIRAHWARWTAPVRAELAARDRWSGAVHEAADAALLAYRTEYLEDPHRFEGLRRAVAELLRLLEIPALAAPMTRLRTTLTWPARRVARAWRGQRARPEGRPAQLTNEERVLQDVLDQMLIVLTRDVGRRGREQGAAVGFWKALDRLLEQRHARMQEDFHAAARRHQEALAAEIKASAQRLYQRLQEHPALLNSLRATRVGADAAAIAVAVKLGGIGINDLLLAPALISVTSLLTEGALGSYVQHEAERLKQRQAQLVEQQVFQAVVVPGLIRLADDLDGPGVWAVEASELAAVEAALGDE